LGDIAAAVAAARIAAPATLVLGRVVECVRQEKPAAAPDHDAIGHHLVGEPR
jgi:hypothetical protein